MCHQSAVPGSLSVTLHQRSHNTWPLFSETVTLGHAQLLMAGLACDIFLPYFFVMLTCGKHISERISPVRSTYMVTSTYRTPSSGQAAPHDDRTSLNEELSNTLPPTFQCPPSVCGALCCMSAPSVQSMLCDWLIRKAQEWLSTRKAGSLYANKCHSFFFFFKATVPRNNT